MSIYKYRGVLARQSDAHKVVTIAVPAKEVFGFASIERAGRDSEGKLRGFQRPQVRAHIGEIQNYLAETDAVLPNSVVVGFVDGVTIRKVSHGIVELTIDTRNHTRTGYVIDGQQRLSALAGLPGKDFEILVTVLVCPNVEELRRQFVLLNSTRALPKTLIYELLPDISGLPVRLSSRSFAAKLTEQLNFRHSSSLRGMIHQYTNPSGVIRDTAIQKVIMLSATNGALQRMPQPKRFEGGYKLLDAFFEGVELTFKEDWKDHTPRTSRLVHGAGIQAMGFVMELLYARDGARSAADFRDGLKVMQGRTAWTSGAWRFSRSEKVPWNKLQNTHNQIMTLSAYLVSLLRPEAKGHRGTRRASG